MTTITINDNLNLDKSEFNNLQELIDYLLSNEQLGVLLPLDKNDITPRMEKRFEKALKTPKSEMLNI
jgi:hypothetical protein